MPWMHTTLSLNHADQTRTDHSTVKSLQIPSFKSLITRKTGSIFLATREKEMDYPKNGEFMKIVIQIVSLPLPHKSAKTRRWRVDHG
jgi:hypothetical protein